MNPLVRQFINHKINSFSSEDLIKLNKVYELKLTKTQISKVLQILKKEKIDIGNNTQLNRLLKQIGISVGKQTEMKIRYLLNILLK